MRKFFGKITERLRDKAESIASALCFASFYRKCSESFQRRLESSPKHNMYERSEFLMNQIRSFLGLDSSLRWNDSEFIYKNNTKHIGTKNFQRGYSLAELSISTSIIAMLAVGGLGVMQKKNESDRVKETYAHIEKVQTALAGFIRSKRYVPCPALPDLRETDANFGKSIATTMTLGDAATTGNPVDITVNGNYNTTSNTCANNGLINGTGMIPVHNLNLDDKYAYDGWGRKFTFRTASASGAKEDFDDDYFAGDLAVVNLKGVHKTNINDSPPNNQGAIYVIISHGGNGKNVVWRRNNRTTSNSPPAQATGIEATNTDHSFKAYIQDKPNASFDDIVGYGKKESIIQPKQITSPIAIDSQTCENSQALVADIRAGTDVYGTYDGTYATTYARIYAGAKTLAKLCKNAPSNTISPSDVAGLRLWLDAADTSTLYQANTCTTTLAVAGTDTAGCWADKSGHANNATAANEPTYNSASINGKNALDFDGANDVFTLASQPIVGTIARTIIVAARADVKNYGAMVSLTSNDGAGRRYGLSPWVSVNTNVGYRDFNQNIQDATIPSIVTVQNAANSDANATSGWKNGTAMGQTGSGSATINTIAGTAKIGATFNSGVYYNGEIAEILIYNRVITPSKRTKLEAYLGDKWGVTVAGGSSVACPTGLTWRKSDDAPEGKCQCAAGKIAISGTTSINACYSGSDNTLGGCVTEVVAPIYSNGPSTTGMFMWLDANDCTTITIDSTTSTANVSTWADRGPVGNDATQAVVASMPDYKLSIQNTLPAISFYDDSNADNFVLPSMASFTAGEVFYIIKADTAGNQGSWDYTNIASDSNYSLSGVIYDKFLTATRHNVGTPTTAITQFNIYNTAASGTNWTARLNSTTEYTTSSATFAAGGVTPTIGINKSALAFQGDFGEIILYERELPTSERKTVNQYLSDKWDLFIDPLNSGNSTSKASLKLWLDASDNGTLFKTSSCSGAVAGNTDGVGCWKDKSGSGYNATQSATLNKPKYTWGGQNNKGVLTFDGADDFMNESTFALGTKASTFAVVTPGTGTGFKRVISNEFNWRVGVGTTTNYFSSFYGDNSSWGTTTDHGADAALTATTYYIVESIVDGTNDNPFVSGVNVGARADTMTAFSDGYTIGKKESTSTEYWDGGIAEIIVYNTNLSTIKRKGVEVYLSDKWGVALP